MTNTKRLCSYTEIPPSRERSIVQSLSKKQFRRSNISRDINQVEYTLNPCKKNLNFNEIKVILRCADEIVGRGGRSLLSKVLKGSKDKKVIELGLDSTPGYGFYKDHTIDEVTTKVDWMIKRGYLMIEYDYRLPLIYFTDIGWDIEKDTYSSELFEKLKTLFDSTDLSFVNSLKDRDRALIFMLLDKIAGSNDKRFIHVLEYWKTIDYKKVRARIEGVIKRLKSE